MVPGSEERVQEILLLASHKPIFQVPFSVFFHRSRFLFLRWASLVGTLVLTRSSVPTWRPAVLSYNRTPVQCWATIVCLFSAGAEHGLEDDPPAFWGLQSNTLGRSVLHVLQRDPRRFAEVTARLHARQLPASLRVYIWMDVLLRQERHKLGVS